MPTLRTSFIFFVFVVIRVTEAMKSALPPKVIILMLGDDYGYNNVGFSHGPSGHDFGHGNPEMRTPNLDQLATDGIVLDRHYVYKYCSPTRSSLMSGRVPPHVNQNNLNNDIEAKSGPDLRFKLLPGKMKDAGYSTAFVGKSHLGARSPANLPINRGFDYHFGFLKGGEDHYSQGSGSKHGEKRTVDLWSGNALANETGIYSGYLYAGKAVGVIEKFAHERAAGAGTKGLFLYLAWHNTHTPLECPPEFMYPSLPAYNNSFKARMTYNCMARILDEGVGNVTRTLKSNGLWNETLILFSADNGGWVGRTGSNNYPLRGSKVSDFEGGVRAVAFLSGGYLPISVRGGRHTGYIHVADWYGTLAKLVGVDPSDNVPGLPPVDSNDFWPSVLVPNATSTGREDIWLSWSCTASSAAVTGCDPKAPSIYNTSGDPTAGQGPGDMAYISKQYKIVIGHQEGRGIWFGPVYPNGTKDYKDDSCAQGCLFDIVKDPTEHVNLKHSMPEMWKTMLAKLLAAGKTLYQTAYSEPGADKCITGEQAAKYYVGHNKCIYGHPGYQPSLPAPACDETIPRLYLGPMCFKTLPPGIPPTPAPSPAPAPSPTPAPSPVFTLCAPGTTKCAEGGPGQQCLVTSGRIKAPLTLGACHASKKGWRANGAVSGWVEWVDARGPAGFIKLNETAGHDLQAMCNRGYVYLNPDEGHGHEPTRQGFSMHNSTTTPGAIDLRSSICVDGATERCLGMRRGSESPTIMKCDDSEYEPWPVLQWQ